MANPYTEIGENYLILGERTKNKENFITAKNWFIKGEKLKLGLQNNRMISEYYQKDFEKITKGIEKCENLISEK